MKVGISITSYSWPGSPHTTAGHVVDLGRRFDDAGIDSLWVADHLLQMDPSAAIDEPMLEAYSTLAFIAGATQRVQLGTMVTWATIRPPALLIKTVTTLDVLSGGRAWLGIGVGYRGDEAAMAGLPFEPTPERFSRLEELLQLSAHMWDGDRTPFEGPHHRLEHPINEPPPSPGPRCSSAAWASSARCPSSPATATPATSSTSPTTTPPCATSSTSSPAPATRSDATPPTSRSPSAPASARAETSSQLTDRAASLAGIGVDHLVFVTTGPWQTGRDLDVLLNAAEPLHNVPRAPHREQRRSTACGRS